MPPIGCPGDHCIKNFFLKVSKHILRAPKTETEVEEILSLRKGSKECSLLLEKIRNKGDYSHNIGVVEKGEGVIVLPDDDWRGCAECTHNRRNSDDIQAHLEHGRICEPESERL